MNTRILDVRQGKVIYPVSELHAKDVRIAELQDALEFSERVLAKLAQVAAMQKKHHCCVDVDVPFHCPGWQSCAERIMSKKDLRPCAFEMLKGVRIEVEEEMDGEKDNS